jgi:hypothetical protein
MKKVMAIIGLGLISSSFALDEYLPVEAGKLEVDFAYNLASKTGDYDSDGDKKDLADGASSSIQLIPLQLKYGIMPGLDVEVVLAYKMTSDKADAAPPFPAVDNSSSGLDQPEIAVKYAMTEIGAGAYVNFIAPFATGDFADPDAPPMALAFGAVYSKLLVPQFNLAAQLQYRLNFEGESKFQAGNVFMLYAKPEFRFSEFGGAYLGLKYEMAGETQFDGKAFKDSDGNMFTVLPGWNATWLPNLATEVNIPYTLMGKNATAYWGINVNVYYTLAL